jgi:hypothetical protein
MLSWWLGGVVVVVAVVAVRWALADFLLDQFGARRAEWPSKDGR